MDIKYTVEKWGLVASLTTDETEHTATRKFYKVALVHLPVSPDSGVFAGMQQGSLYIYKKSKSEEGITVSDTEEWEYFNFLVRSMAVPLEYISTGWYTPGSPSNKWKDRDEDIKFDKLYHGNRYRLKERDTP